MLYVASCISFSVVNRNQQPGAGVWGEVKAALPVLSALVAPLFKRYYPSLWGFTIFFSKPKATLTKKQTHLEQRQNTINVSLLAC